MTVVRRWLVLHLRVRLPAAALSRATLGKLFTRCHRASSINWYRRKWKAVGLASHWRCVTDSAVYSITGSTYDRDTSITADVPSGTWHLYLPITGFSRKTFTDWWREIFFYTGRMLFLYLTDNEQCPVILGRALHIKCVCPRNKFIDVRFQFVT